MERHIREVGWAHATLPFALPGELLPSGSDPALGRAHARIRALEARVTELEALLKDAQTEKGAHLDEDLLRQAVDDE